MKETLELAIEKYRSCAYELETAMNSAVVNGRFKVTLIENRLMRGRILDGSIHAARAERRVLDLPITGKAYDIAVKNAEKPVEQKEPVTA